jgi:methylenetetrahydrofolate reductase (NADPH)
MNVGGDVDDVDVGAFLSSRAALETGFFRRHGFKAIGFATYAEPRARIAQHILESELARKVDLATQPGLSSWLVSQLCFNPELIIKHALALRSSGIVTPLDVGMAGPTSWKAIARCVAAPNITLGADWGSKATPIPT